MRKVQEITLERAVSDIRLTIDRLPRRFFFLVGAGVSYPPVPLAGSIVESCKKVVPSAQRPDGIEDPMEEYSWWFQRAFPSPADRQSYLRKLIENKYVSHANLRLAHVLLHKKIANLVVTVNFDDFISKSLTLFGEPHIVCDHPETIQRIDLESNDVQIVHVHGTYWFYDCCNLQGEIEARSRKSVQTASSMGDFLDQLLMTHSPLVLGYSGWSGDVVMEALKRRLRRGLAYNIYWFCYQRSTIHSLPEEVRTHPNVFFVVAEPPKTAPDPARARVAQSDSSLNSPQFAEPTLSASDVLDDIVKGFQLDAPPLTRDPLKFFANQLRSSLPQDEVTSGQDIYLIRKVISRIERAAQSLSQIEEKLQSVADAVRRSEYKQAIRSGLEIPKEDLDDQQAIELMEALCLAGSKLLDASDDELASYGRVLDFGNDLLKKTPEDPAVAENVAIALVNRGNSLGEVQRLPDAFQSYNETIERFGNATAPELRYQVARAVYNKGATYERVKNPEGAFKAYTELVDGFQGSTDPRIRDLLAWATYRQGVHFGDLGQHDREEEKYREVLDRFGSDTALDCPELCVLALDALGDARISQAKEARLAHDEDRAKKHFEEAREFFSRASERAPDHPYVLASQGYLEFLQGNRDRAKELMVRALNTGGEDLRADLEVPIDHPLPEDAEFTEMLKSIPAPRVAAPT